MKTFKSKLTLALVALVAMGATTALGAAQAAMPKPRALGGHGPALRVAKPLTTPGGDRIMVKRLPGGKALISAPSRGVTVIADSEDVTYLLGFLGKIWGPVKSGLKSIVGGNTKVVCMPVSIVIKRPNGETIEVKADCKVVQ